MTVILFWDIDGTLLTTGRAGILAWEEATRELTGRSVDLDKMETAGLTDAEIAVNLLATYQIPPTSDNVRRLLEAYEHHLPGRLHWRSGQVLPGVRQVLDHLRGRSDAISLLLTGNTRAGAAAKLGHYKLDSYFSFGAFADDGPDRAAIARRALEIATERLVGNVSLERIYVIGDTPHDIRCGKAIGARTIAVASGSYTVAALKEHSPWWIMNQFPDPDTFMKKLEL